MQHVLDEETRRYAEIIKAKTDRLHFLDKQAATMGKDSPPHIEMERGSLREELGMMEIAVQSPARAAIGDELGPRGRFIVNLEQNREIKQSIAAVAVQLETFIKTSLEWRTMHRNWILIIGLAVVIILVIIVALVTYLVTKGSL